MPAKPVKPRPALTVTKSGLVLVVQSRMAARALADILAAAGFGPVPILAVPKDAPADQGAAFLRDAAAGPQPWLVIAAAKDFDALGLAQSNRAFLQDLAVLRFAGAGMLGRAAEQLVDASARESAAGDAEDGEAGGIHPDLTTWRVYIGRAFQQEQSLNRAIPARDAEVIELDEALLHSAPGDVAARVAGLLGRPAPTLAGLRPLSSLRQRQQRIDDMVRQARSMAQNFRITFRKERVPLEDNDPRRVAVVMMVKDEEDIIYENLLWHFAVGIRQFVILDNLSTDGTRSEIRRFGRLCEPMGAKLLVLDDAEVGYYQSRKTTAAANLAYNYFGAEWVIPLDADEFLYPERGDLLEALAGCERNVQRQTGIQRGSPLFMAAINIPTRNHVCTADDNPDELSPTARMTRGERGKGGGGFKSAALWAPDLAIGQGNHNIRVMRAPVPTISAAPAGLHIRHFPVRSFAHFVRKTRNGGRAYLNAPELAHLGKHWQEWYAVLTTEGEDGLRKIFEAKFQSPVSETRFDPMPRVIVRHDGVALEAPGTRSRDAPIMLPIHGEHAVSLAGKEFAADRVVITAPVTGTPLTLRLNSSDIATCNQVFVQCEYDIAFGGDLEFILDLGANIGLAAVYFAGRYPAASIVSVEPNGENFAVLSENIRNLPNLRAVMAAVWHEPGRLRLVNEDAEGKALGFWGTRTSPAEGGGDGLVEAVTVNQLVERFGFPRIDLLKVDIEGAELELFSHHAARWLPLVRHVVVETHDRFKPGSRQAVVAALEAAGFSYTKSGENLVFTRNAA